MRLIAAQTAQQRRKLAAVLFGYRGKLHSQASTGHPVTNHRVGTDLALTYQKIDLRWSSNDAKCRRLQEKAAETQITHA